MAVRVIQGLKTVWTRRWVPPSMGKAPYVWMLSLLFMGIKYLHVRPGALEVALLVITALAFMPVYFNSLWRSNRALAPHLAFTLALGLAWAPYNSGSGNFLIFAAAMCARIERRLYAYLGVALIMLVAGLAAWIGHLPLSFLLPVVVFGPLVGVATILDENVRRSREQLLRKQSEVEHLARIAERERISRDLHDLLGHTLSLITLKAELAGKLMERDPAACRAEIRDIEQTARQALSEVRSAVTGIRQTGLVHELATAHASLAAADVRLSEQVQSFALPAALENVLSLALREAVTNILRHANATCCEVMMALESGMVVLRVRDDGATLAKGDAVPHGNGLSGMKERVAALGGSMALRVERGLTLELSLPIKELA